MSQSPLARKRKSLTAFSRPPSQLSHSVTHSALDTVLDEEPEASPSRSASSSSLQSTARSRRHRDDESHESSHDSPRRESRRFVTETPSSSRRQSSQHQPTTETPTRSLRDAGRRSTMHDFKPYTPQSGGTPKMAPTAAPHLIYSPYATPPAGLSRSSSVPFDMAASAAAARQTQERLKAVGTSTPSADKKKRFVRRKPWWLRIIESPGNMVDTALFHVPSSVEEVLPPVRWANPIALALYVIHWLLLAPLRAVRDETDSILKGEREVTDSIGNRWQRKEAVARGGVAGTRIALLYTVLLFALSAANAAWLFTRFRTYDMQLRSGRQPVSSPHASPIPAPTRDCASPGADDDELPAPDEAPAAKAARLAGKGAWILAKWSYRSILSAVGARPPASITGTRRGDSIQSLRVWDPPEFCLAFFCAMPPSAPIIACLFTGKHPFATPFLLAVTTTLLSHLAACFAQLVKDRMILSAEVMREYDQRFVYKRVFAPMVDRGVGTSDSIMLP